MLIKTNLKISIVFFVFIGLCPWNLHAFQKSQAQTDTIRIGLLIPDNKSFAARQGAELAIRIANEKAGSKAKHFTLVVKTMEGPWGTGSKQAVSLIFDDKVTAIIGSHDGRNAHLVEQAATKARVVLMSAWSGDPTLSQAFVPWFFNVVPNNNQQADAFIEEIYTRRKLSKIALVSDNSYDSELAIKSFIIKSELSGKPQPLMLSFKENTNNTSAIIEQIKNAGIEGLILFGECRSSRLLLSKLRKAQIDIPVFGSLAILDEKVFSGKDFADVVFISPGTSGMKADTFKNEYQKFYKTQPGAVAAYAFDGMNLLIESIISSGTERENIQNALLNISYEGVTGTITFDENGNRKGTPDLMEIKNGLHVEVH